MESAKPLKLAFEEVGVTDGDNIIQTLTDSFQTYLPRLPYLQRIEPKPIQLAVKKSFLESADIKILRNSLTDSVRLAKARVHPLHLLTAWKTYSSGHGHKGNLTWEVDGRIKDILEDAFTPARR